MTDVDKVGGIPVILRALLDAGLLHGDCLTVTGKTMAENLKDITPPDPDGERGDSLEVTSFIKQLERVYLPGLIRA